MDYLNRDSIPIQEKKKIEPHSSIYHKLPTISYLKNNQRNPSLTTSRV